MIIVLEPRLTLKFKIEMERNTKMRKKSYESTWFANIFDFSDYAFAVAAPKLWSSLPQSIKSAFINSVHLCIMLVCVYECM